MKTKTILILLIAFCASRGDITTVTVPQTMVHVPNAAVGINGFTGKVDYLLAPLTNDSVFVTLSIEPQAGGTALALTKATGDIGVIKVNTNAPSTAQKYTIYFEAASPQVGVPYVAKITANAVTSNMMTDLNAKMASLSKSQKSHCAQAAATGSRASAQARYP
jgi:hypothetical protein